jgi:unsaturated pyranuronate lyase
MNPKNAQIIVFEDEEAKPGVQRGVWHGGPFTVVQYKYVPGAIFPSHSHESSQLTIVLKGTIEFSVGKDKLTVQAGETIYLPSNQPHGAQIPKEGEPVDSINIFYPKREEHP